MSGSAQSTLGLGVAPSTFVQTLLDDINAAIFCKTLGIAGPDGWVDDTAETWAYVSADAPTFVFSVNADVTTKYAVGQRIKLTQTTAKYFIITAVGAYSAGVTPITVYGGTDYVLANAAISANYHSMIKAPVGFPLSPLKWTVSLVNATDTIQSATAGTWYNIASLSISIPIGVWNVQFQALIQTSRSGLSAEMFVALGITAAAAGDSQFDAYYYTGSTELDLPYSGTGVINVASKTPYYINAKCPSTSNIIGFLGTRRPTRVTAVCAYL